MGDLNELNDILCDISRSRNKPRLKARPMNMPAPPLCRVINDGFGHQGTCDKCSSSLKRKWYDIFGLSEPLGCLQPECDNYWEKNQHKKIKYIRNPPWTR
jgi:hypothetical protein